MMGKQVGVLRKLDAQIPVGGGGSSGPQVMVGTGDRPGWRNLVSRLIP